MKNKFGRAIDHLTDELNEEKIFESFQAVEDLFKKDWLNSNNGHRLQDLWLRKDYLSSSELYSLGKSIIRLKKDNEVWLKSTANEIKKNIDTSHGLITEIIIIGALESENGVIKPCTKSYPTYDYTVKFSNNYGYKVSIKNYDISIHEKKFIEESKIIRKCFLAHIDKKKLSGSLTINIEGSLDRIETFKICCFIASDNFKFGSYMLEGKTSITFKDISNDYPVKLPSDICVITAKQNKNEQRNLISKIDTANKKLLKEEADEYNIKKLIIRLGETADINKLKDHIQSIADNEEACGFDMCLLIQPLLCQDPSKNSSHIHTTIIPISARTLKNGDIFLEKLKNLELLTFNIGVGSTDSTPPELTTSLGDQIKDCYLFQQGEIYVSPKSSNKYYTDFDLSQIALGIKVNAVHNGMIFSPKVFSSNSKPLIL